MITCGSDGMMIPKPRLSMNTDSRTKVSAAREVVMGSRILRHMSGAVLVSFRLHPGIHSGRNNQHEPDRYAPAGDRARAAVAALRRPGLGRVPDPLRQDLAHRLRAAAAHVA